jgi:sugar/nucleoside kinase (ribokinase family)
MGPRSAVITLGRAGSIGKQGAQLVRQPSLGDAAVDTTGLGNVFHGAFGYALARDFGFERALELASAVAGMSAEARGARAGLPTLTRVARLLPWLKHS